jgi:DNA-3-methyladenine glycosylase II
VLRLAFLRDSLDTAGGVALRSRDGVVQASAPEALRPQVERILSLDIDGTGYEQVGERDPVVGRLMRAKPGLRPVLYPTPYEAATWAVLSARVRGAQALALRRRLMEEHGEPVDVEGETLPTFPAPATVLALSEVDGLPAQKLERLHGVARAALDGTLDPCALRALEPEAALERLRGIHGIGPFFAELILLRGTGFPDVMPLAAPRIRAEVASAYGLAEEPDDARLLEIAEPWRPFRSWVCLLLRAA